MKYEVRLAAQATRDLRSIYLAKQAETSHHAAAWFLGLREAVLSLETIPYRGVSTSEDNSVRHLLYGNKPHIYRIIYSINDEVRTVNIAQIRHRARAPLQQRES